MMTINENRKALFEQVARDNPGKEIDCYVLFPGHTDAMQLYSLARAAGIRVRISATPRTARSSCGVSLLASCDDADIIEKMAREGGVPLEAIVALPRQIDSMRDRYC